MTRRATAEILDSGRVAVHGCKALVVLEPAEILLLLPGCRSLWVEALKRGKALRRSLAVERRDTKAQAVHEVCDER